MVDVTGYKPEGHMHLMRAFPFLLVALSAAAQQTSTSRATVVADFAVAAEHPLVKDKIGVYQTPFMGTRGYPGLTAMEPFLAEAGVRDLRYEVAWGKPDVCLSADRGHCGGTDGGLRSAGSVCGDAAPGAGAAADRGRV